LPDPVLTVTDGHTRDDEALIGQALNAFNERHTGVVHSRRLAILMHQVAGGALIGGLVGRTSLGLLFIDLVFVPEVLRGSGVGTELVRRAETEAIVRGCTQSVLYTIAFQAPAFYGRLGYQVFGEVRSGPADQARLFMTKALGVG